MKVFVTGGTGFIGTHLVRRLLQDGHTVHCLVRSLQKGTEIEKAGAKLFVGDVTDKASINPGMQGCDWVAHLAGVYSFWEPDKSIYRKVNVDGTRNVMECCLENKVKKVIYVSTVAVWGKPDKEPFDEETPVGPVRFCEYGKTKYEGELIAWEMHAKHGLPLVIIYPAAVIGPGDTRATGRYFRMLLNNKLPFRVFSESNLSFVYVGDVAEAINQALHKKESIGQRYIIAAETLSIKEISKIAVQLIRTKLPLFSLPDFIVLSASWVLTAVANIFKRPPIWDLSKEQALTMANGFNASGYRGRTTLGVHFMDIKHALKEFIENDI